MKIIYEKNFTDYLNSMTKKHMIVWHGTASGVGTNNDIYGWLNDKLRAVATPFLIGRDGIIHQLFDPRYDCYHTGINGANKSALGIEFDNWNWLVYNKGSYYSWTGQKIDKSRVVELPEWKGYRFFEKLTEEQMDAGGELTFQLSIDFDIPLEFKTDWINNPSDFNGVCTHACINKSKYDFHPELQLFL